MFHLLSHFLVLLGLHRRQPSNLPSIGIQFGRVKLLSWSYSSEAWGACVNFAVFCNCVRKVLDSIRFAFFVGISPSEGTSENYSGSVSTPPAGPLLFSHTLPQRRQEACVYQTCMFWRVLHSRLWLTALPHWHKQIKPYTSSTEKKQGFPPKLVKKKK